MNQPRLLLIQPGKKPTKPAITLFSRMIPFLQYILSFNYLVKKMQKSRLARAKPNTFQVLNGIGVDVLDDASLPIIKEAPNVLNSAN